MAMFPNNPSDGMIVEVSPGKYFRFSTRQNSWFRLDSFDALGVATATSDGLMSSNDLKKLNDILVPPPRMAISSEDCEFTFNSGFLGFRSSKEHLAVNTLLSLSGLDDAEPWQIHENTFGVDFKIDLDKLVEELQARDGISFRGTIGPQGLKGDKGQDGQDNLDTGPVGLVGPAGANAPFPGTLSREVSGDFDIINENTAIVDAQIKELSDVDRVLVLTRANIGNIDACPGSVKPKRFDSPFALVIDDNPARAEVRKEISSDDCKIACAVCSELHYIDIQNIVDQVAARFKELVLDLKAAKEALADNWLSTMISVFNQQRDAICCALENCESRKRNQNERRYIESQRIQAAQSDFRLELDGTNSRSVFDLEPDKDCADPGGAVIEGPQVDCSECFRDIVVDGKLNAGTQNKAISTTIPAGQYVAEIEDCCIKFRGGLLNTVNQWSGRISLKYNTADGPNTITIPNLGEFDSNDDARSAYIGQCFSFVHTGGDIMVWSQSILPENNSGSVSICIRTADCFEAGTEATGAQVGDDVSSCEMAASQVEWYERGWRTDTCCGAHVKIGGVQYLVVKRSIGTDSTCGGGESESTPCLASFIDAGKGHPAIAFPTLDGDEFAGKPMSGTQTFVEDDNLSSQVINKIKNGEAISTVGDAAGQITLVLFPTAG